MTYSIAQLVERFPSIKWAEPIQVMFAGRRAAFSCRVCIANYGLAYTSEHQWDTPEEVMQHIEETHL